jgi:hypothetical protein
LKELPYEIGDKVECYGFEGKLYRGTVTSCEHVDAGYARFIRVKVKLDRFGNEIQFNWSLFPDRVRKLEEEKKDEK